MVGTTNDFADLRPLSPLSFNYLFRKICRTADRIGEVRLIRIIRRPRDVPHQMKVVAAGTAAITGLVDERADNVDAETADGALFGRRIETRHSESERVEWRRIVDDT